MNTPAAHALPMLLALLLKGTLLLITACAASLLLRRASAAMRHLVWAAALVAVLLLPILSLSLPRWSVAAAPPALSSPATPGVGALAPPPAPPAAPVVEAAQPAASAPEQAMDSRAARAETAAATAAPPAPGRSSRGLSLWIAVAGAIWSLGFLAVIGQFIVGLGHISRLRKQSQPLDAAALAIAEQVRQRLGARGVDFLRASGNCAAVPVTWGLFRPVVLLPEQSVFWSEGCLRAALLHETAHVQRGDWLMQGTARLACALYWWHPLVWLAAKQARAESERACDNLALGTGMQAADYAQALVEVVRSMPAKRQPRSVAIAMAQPSEVEGRLRAVLARGSCRRPLTRMKTAAACVLVMLLALPLAALRLTPSAQAKDAAPANPIRGARAALDRVIVADSHAAIVDGDRAIFPNGYEVSLVAVTQAVRTGDEWDMFGGPWWRPDGTSIAPQSGGLNGHWHWSVAHTHGLAPFVFKAVFHAPASAWKHGESSAGGFYQQFLGALKPGEYGMEGHIVTNGPHPIDQYITRPLVDGSAPQRFGGAVGGTRCAEIYPVGTRACTVRFGVAAGPWRTIASRPFALTPASVTSDRSQSARYLTDVSLTLDDSPRETYLDKRGRPRVLPFLGAGRRLSNVARRIVAVDGAGRIVPLNEFGEQRVALAFGRKSDVSQWNPALDLARVKEFRLQTCPYQTVEFRSIALQPALAADGSPPPSATLLTQAGAHQLEQARQLRAHLQPWAQNSKPLLQQMAQARPGDLAALMQVYSSFQRLPFPLWQGDPRAGQGNEDAPFAMALPSRLTLAHLQRSQDFTETRVRRDFTRFHDLAVAQSVNAGRSHLTVWASGRITRTTTTDKFMGHGQPMGTEESEQEIVPAFFGGDSASSTAGDASQAGQPALGSAVAKTPAPRFRRYVSLPLPDGTRCTFLYPASLRRIAQGSLDQSS